MIDPVIASSVVGIIGTLAGFSVALLEHVRLGIAQRRLAIAQDSEIYWRHRADQFAEKLSRINAGAEKGRAVQAAKRRAATGTESESFAALRGEIAA